MALKTSTFDQFVDNFVKAWAAQLLIDPNLQPGDPLLAIAECDAAQAVAVQLMDQETIDFARAQTCVAEDLDSWMAQFAFARLPARAATGQVQFSAASPATQQIFIPVGTTVQVPGGAISYQVIADSSFPAFNSSFNAYIIPIGQQSVNVAMQALVTGSSYNVQAGQLSQLVGTVFGIQTITNIGAIIDGADQETDDAYRARFVEYLNSLSQATATAIRRAVLGLEAGLKITLLENVQIVGNPPTGINEPYFGNVVVLVDDGTGSPPAALISAAYTAVAETVAYGIQFQVLAPAVLQPNIRQNIIVKAGALPAVVIKNVTDALVKYVNSLQIGDTIYLDKVIQIAIDADPNVISVQANSTFINNVTNDLVLARFQEAVITASNITVAAV